MASFAEVDYRIITPQPIPRGQNQVSVSSDATIENVTNDIVALLITERDRFNRAIEALQGARRRGRPPKWLTGPKPRRGRPPKSVTANPIPEIKPRRQRKPMSAAERKAHSKRMKKYWAERRRKEKP